MDDFRPHAANRHPRMCKLSRRQDYLTRKPNFAGIDLGDVSGTVVTNLTWGRDQASA